MVRRTRNPRSRGREPLWLLAPILLALAAPLPALTAEGQDCAGQTLADPELASAWRTLRAVDCARCHGREYEGMVGPSIVEFVRTQDRERFEQIVLDGVLQRGMPGYSNVPRVANDIDDIYRYFQARAEGTIGPEDRPPPRTAQADAGDEQASAAKC